MSENKQALQVAALKNGTVMQARNKISAHEPVNV